MEWNTRASELRKQGFKITTPNLLEKNATPEDHKSGLDIADYFISVGYPPLEGGAQACRVEGGGYPFLETRLSSEERRQEMSAGQREPLAFSKTDNHLTSLISKNRTILNLVNTLSPINPNTNRPFHVIK